MIELIGVPFDGFGRPGNQARASTALRAAGLASAFGSCEVHDTGDLELPPPSTERGVFLNEPALVAMAAQLHDRVRDSVAAGRFPFVFGGDCSGLLGIVPALPGVGLVFLDGHEDTMPLDVSEDGEAANAEIGLLLGLTGGLLTGPRAASAVDPPVPAHPLARARSALAPERLAMIGPRDGDWRRRFNVGSVGDLGVWLRRADQVADRPADTGREAVQHLSRTADRWWLHVDLDVLDPVVFPAQGLPGVPDDPGGLTWDELTGVVSAALAYGGCAGASMTIYDPDQDPDGTCAHQILQAISRVT